MSDKKNRDVGRKRSVSKYKNLCGCWLCEPGKHKRKVLLNKALTKHPFKVERQEMD